MIEGMLNACCQALALALFWVLFENTPLKPTFIQLVAS